MMKRTKAPRDRMCAQPDFVFSYEIIGNKMYSHTKGLVYIFMKLHNEAFGTNSSFGVV